MEIISEVAPENNTNTADSIEIKMDPFSMKSVFDFHEKFDEEIWALKALCQLLGSADLEIFVEHEGKRLNNNYQWGLQQLFELCVEKQEQGMQALRDMASNSPECIIERARKLPDEIDRGWYVPPFNNKDIHESLNNLEIVLDLFGPERYPEADIIKKQILDRIQRVQKPDDSSLNAGNGTDG